MDKKNLTKTFNQITQEKIAPLITGFRDLDCILSGIEKGNLITIGARPAMGKTSLMTSILYNLLKSNKKCLLFSLEITLSQYIKRLIAQVGEIDIYDILNNKRINEIKNALDIISCFNLSIFDDTYKIDEIREKIEIEKPDYVFIDYLQLLDTAKNLQQHSEEITNIMIELKKIAKENKCIIFILSQLSRAVERRCNRRPILSDFIECSDIENISDVVMFIYREKYYKSYDSEDEYALNKDEAEIIIAKNKMGAIGTIKLLFKSSIAKFFEPIINDTLY